MASNYQIADRDEMEAYGRDSDTSAGLHPHEDVQPASDPAVSSPSGRGKCVVIVGTLLMIAGAAIFVSVFLTQRSSTNSGAGGSDTNANPDPNPLPPAVQNPSPVSADTPPPSILPTPTPPPSSAPSPPAATAEIPTFGVTVVSKMPHDSHAFIQGFEYAGGHFYEGTGLYKRSSLRRVEMDTGNVLQQYDYADSSLFGEGITLHKDEHIFMLTWKSGRGFVFNQTSLEVIREWQYDGEGWGLTMDRHNDEVYMSDGTNALRVLDPETLGEKRRVSVTRLDERPVSELNELEWVCGEVWANVWQTKDIYRIDPASGLVKGIIKASALPLKDDVTPGMDVLNGIAFDPDTGRLWLTGKLWNSIYQVTVSDPSLDLTNCKV